VEKRENGSSKRNSKATVLLLCFSLLCLFLHFFSSISLSLPCCQQDKEALGKNCFSKFLLCPIEIAVTFAPKDDTHSQENNNNNQLHKYSLTTGRRNTLIGPIRRLANWPARQPYTVAGQLSQRVWPVPSSKLPAANSQQANAAER